MSLLLKQILNLQVFFIFLQPWRFIILQNYQSQVPFAVEFENYQTTFIIKFTFKHTTSHAFLLCAAKFPKETRYSGEEGDWPGSKLNKSPIFKMSIHMAAAAEAPDQYNRRPKICQPAFISHFLDDGNQAGGAGNVVRIYLHHFSLNQSFSI